MSRTLLAGRSRGGPSANENKKFKFKRNAWNDNIHLQREIEEP